MADETREIRARVDILDLVGQRVSLKRTGKTWKGLCPFHEDRNPSFTVSPETGRYKCWSCGESGDIFTWVMKTQNVEFVEALQILAKAAGVTLSGRAGAKQDPSQRETWQKAMVETLGFFREQLAKSSPAKEYCARRGIPAEVMSAWELGYAPDVGDLLANTLKRKGLPLGECRQLFLVDQDPSGGFFDRFRGRLMFPIRDERGEVVAFGGRILGDGLPKYINSGDTPLFRKSRVLYGLYRAKDALQKERRAILVEGYLDVIACQQAGVAGALASLGTSLTEEHAKLLKRWCDEVVILYDSDEAGQKAARRAIDVLNAEGLRVRVALMPAGEDPDTLLKAGGPAALLRAIQQSVSPIEYEIHELRRKQNPEDEEFWKQAVSILSRGTNLEFERLAPGLAPLYPDLKDPILAMKALRRDVAKAKRDLGWAGGAGLMPAAKVMAPGWGDLLPSELRVFSAILDDSFRATAWPALRDVDLFITSIGRTLAEELVRTFPQGPPEGPPAAWIGEIQPEEVKGLLGDLELDPRWVPITDVALSDALAHLTLRRSERERASLKTGTSSDADLLERYQHLKRHKPKYEH